jgi:hypothetical protein
MKSSVVSLYLNMYMCEVSGFSFGSYAEDCKIFTLYSKTFLIQSAWDQKIRLWIIQFFQCYVVHWTPNVML